MSKENYFKIQSKIKELEELMNNEEMTKEMRQTVDNEIRILKKQIDKKYFV